MTRRSVALGFVAGYVAALLISVIGAAHGHWIKRATNESERAWLERGQAHYRYVANAGTGEPRRSHARALAWARRELHDLLTIVPYPWGALAECESGRTPPAWSIVTGNGFLWGLQFHPGTWNAHRASRVGRDYPPASTYLARGVAPWPVDQVVVARRVLADEGWGAWPACAAHLGLR